MTKKIGIGISILIAILLIGGGSYYFLNKPANVSEPKEQIEIGNNNDESVQNALIVYFSVPETNDPNKEMTTEEENSTVIIDGEVLGNTEYVAMLINEYTGADIYRIEPETPYTTNHEELVDQALEEQNNNTRPAIKSRITNFDDYEIIYLGYPIWWSDLPQIIYSFMDLYDFSGKTVIPFSTHGGSGLARTVQTIQSYLPTATIEQNAFTLSRNNMETAPEEVRNWLQEINQVR